MRPEEPVTDEDLSAAIGLLRFAQRRYGGLFGIEPANQIAVAIGDGPNPALLRFLNGAPTRVSVAV